jgi:hypothetical protein
VISTSGVLVTLVAAVTALASQSKDFSVSKTAAAFALSALSLFVIACASGILANLPRGHEEVAVDDPGGLASLTEQPAFRAPKAAADRRIAEVRLVQLRSLRAANARKAYALFAGLTSEVLALLCLTIAAAVIVVEGL